MNMTISSHDGAYTVSVSGWLDTEAAPSLKEELEKITEAKEIVLDFRDLEYISSSGLRAVVQGYKNAKEMGAAFSILHVSDDVMEEFNLTNLNRKIDIRQDPVRD